MCFIFHDGIWVVHIPFDPIMVNVKFSHKSCCPPCSVYSYTFQCKFASFAYYLWLIVSSMSPHNQHLLFCCVFTIFALISSLSCRTAKTDLPDPLSPTASINHHSWEFFKAISCIGTELFSIGSSRSSCLCSSIWRGPREYITYEFVLTSPVESRMSGSCNVDSFRDGW